MSATVLSGVALYWWCVDKCIWQMFIKDNQDGSDKTQIDCLGFIGTPVNATNMADFKRVSVYQYSWLMTLYLFVIILREFYIINKSAQSNLWRGPRRRESKSEVSWLQRRAPNLPPKVPLPVDQSPNRITCLIPGTVQPMMPHGIRIRSAIFPQCSGQTDERTDRQIVHRKVWSLYRPLRSESNAA